MSEPTKSSKLKDYTAASALVGAGAASIHHDYHQGGLDGRYTMYHGTSDDAAEGIRTWGMKPGSAINVNDGQPYKKGWSYFTPSKKYASNFAWKSQKFDDRESGFASPSHGTILKARLPLGTMPVVDMNDYVDKDPEHVFYDDSPFHKRYELPINGDIDAKYFKGEAYKSVTKDELLTHIKSNPGKFAKAVGLPTALAGTAAYLAHREKQAEETSTVPAPPLANFKALAAGPKGSLHTALGVDQGVPLPEDLLAHAAEHHEDPAIRTRAQMVLEIKRWRDYKVTNSGNPYLEKAAENLEKQALNALKARQMAKEVGVIADHESNWKYALRNLRDGRGAPLQGQPRREALNRLAGGRDIIREHQQMAAAQRKVRDVDEIQQANSKGKVLLPPTAMFGMGHLHPAAMAEDSLMGKNVERMSEALLPVHAPNNPAALSLSHVHPTIGKPSSPKIIQYGREINGHKELMVEHGQDARAVEDDFTHRFSRSDTPHRLAGASGGYGPQQAMRYMDKPQRVRLVAGDPATAKIVEQAAVAATGDYEGYLSAMSEFRENTKKLKYHQQGVRMGGMNGDQASFSQVYNNQVNPIHAPSVHAIGLHKVTTGGPGAGVPIGRRSVYLDMTPRKMKTS